MERLVFIDDDPDELESMREIAEGHYEYTQIQWPCRRPLEDVVGEPPAIFVLDLYLPLDNSQSDEVLRHELAIQREAARDVADCFSKLYDEPHDDPKKRLRRTMACLTRGRALVDAQWRAMGQSPENGVSLLRRLRTHVKYGRVPVAFYSRRITPEDVVTVLKAGAIDAIRKRLPRDLLLQRFARAQEIHRSVEAEEARRLGLNVNFTVLPD